jgi:uncharacterized membrane protein
MAVLMLSFLLGCVAGLRSLTAPALVCWGAHLGWLHLAGSKFAFINHASALIFFTLLAVVELVIDKLPKTPARTAPIGLIARLVFGGSCGIAVSTSVGMSPSIGAVAAAIGALVGAFSGYNIRQAMVSRAHMPDFAVALAEDMIAIVGGLLIVSHL